MVLAFKGLIVSEILEWSKGRLDFSGGCLVMGILNVTPDSFSDGGEFFDVEKAVSRGVQMGEDGAAIIDIGPESTRPGSEPVSADEQVRRAVPVIERLAAKMTIPISIDTYEPMVAERALAAGAGMINDITALAKEAMAEAALRYDVPVVLMHMQNEPRTMQKNPVYADVVGEVLDFLVQRARYAEERGIDREKIFIDPGIGFGKTLEHNLSLMKNIDKFADTGYRVLVGTSRKRFIGVLTGKDEPMRRDFGTAATVTVSALKGASIVRVHDVSQVVDVVKVTNAIKKA